MEFNLNINAVNNLPLYVGKTCEMFLVRNNGNFARQYSFNKRTCENKMRNKLQTKHN